MRPFSAAWLTFSLFLIVPPLDARERKPCDDPLEECFGAKLSVVFDESESANWDPGEVTFDPDACACLELAERERSENCDDGDDNDEDGLIDCADPDCADHPRCSPSVCDPGDPLNLGCRIVNLSVVLDTPRDNVRGWSFSLAHDEDVLQLVAPTTQGTDTELRACATGFNLTRAVDGGVVSAVILCFFGESLLPGESTILRASYVLKETPKPSTTIRFPEVGLSLNGEDPVRLEFGVDGASLLPDRMLDGCLGLCDEIVGEICGNGLDDDGDGAIDCEDAACVRSCHEEPFIRGDADGNGQIN
ncbi:MAG: hypothetical protein AAF517_02630, partial [Planctomycetota bacterium]